MKDLTPQNKRELVVLSNLIYNPVYRHKVMLYLTEGDFTNKEYQKIYSTLKEQIRSLGGCDPLRIEEKHPSVYIPTPQEFDTLIDPLRASSELKERGSLERVNKIVSDFLIKTADRVEDPAKEIEQLIKDINQPVLKDFGGMGGSDAINLLMDISLNDTKPVGKTGISRLDDTIKGIERGHVYVVAAGSGVGKTMFGVQVFAESMFTMGTACMYLSNEMSIVEIVSRLLARDVGRSARDIRLGNIKGAEDSYAFYSGRLAERMENTKSILIDKMHNYERALSAIRYYVMERGIKLVVVDHLHNFSGDFDGIYDHVSTVAHGLQAIAQDLNIAVIILSQISGENLKSNNIELISGKGAKDLEEVANVQIILQRKKVDTEGNDPSLMHIVVNKNRDGQTGVTDARVEFPNMVIKTIYG